MIPGYLELPDGSVIKATNIIAIRVGDADKRLNLQERVMVDFAQLGHQKVHIIVCGDDRDQRDKICDTLRESLAKTQDNLQP